MQEDGLLRLATSSKLEPFEVTYSSIMKSLVLATSVPLLFHSFACRNAIQTQQVGTLARERLHKVRDRYYWPNQFVEVANLVSYV